MDEAGIKAFEYVLAQHSTKAIQRCDLRAQMNNGRCRAAFLSRRPYIVLGLGLGLGLALGFRV